MNGTTAACVAQAPMGPLGQRRHRRCRYTIDLPLSWPPWPLETCLYSASRRSPFY